MRRSHRAKHNMTINLKGRLAWMQNDLKTEELGLKTARHFCKLLKKPFLKSTSYKAYTQGIRKTKQQIRDLKRLILRRQRNNECYKIL